MVPAGRLEDSVSLHRAAVLPCTLCRSGFPELVKACQIKEDFPTVSAEMGTRAETGTRVETGTRPDKETRAVAGEAPRWK